MKILLTEDSEMYRHLLCTHLAHWGYAVEAVTDAESALPIISASPVPIVLLLDWELPGMSGLELLAEVRRLPLKHYAYVILLTARDTKADLVAALYAGADDYLVKPFDVEELRARLQVAVRTLALHEALVNANERLETLVAHDPLTDLLNRRALLNGFHRECLTAQRRKSAVTLVMCDIDHFKRVNDTCGHCAGDAVLKTVARALLESSRGSDLVGRIGGDEFLMVLPGSDASGGIALVQRVRDAIAESKELREVEISLSFGLALVDVEQSEEVSITKVDAALYAAKRNGRNRYCVAE